MPTFLDRYLCIKSSEIDTSEKSQFNDIYQNEESPNSIHNPSGKPGRFVVLTPLSKTHFHDDSWESPGKIALEDGIRMSDEGKYESAKYFYDIAAAHGEIVAIHNLATMYLHGQGTPKDLDTARRYFIRCAAQGYALSMSQLGYIYMYGKGVEVDYRKAREWFMRASEIGNEPYAQFSLAVIYLNGYGVDINMKEGVLWLYRSAENKFIPALYNLGVFAENGDYGMDADWNDALEFYKRAAKIDNDVYSMNNLAALYCKIGKKPKVAVELYKKAADRGLSQAMYNLGEAYMLGVGVSSDPIKAATYYYRAAKASVNSQAEYALAVIFYNGVKKKIKPNLSVARYWLEMASSHGHMNARRSLIIMNENRKKSNSYDTHQSNNNI